MKQLTDKQLQAIAKKILATEPYKSAFDSSHYRAFARRMSIEAMQMALDAARDDDGAQEVQP